MTIEQNKKQEQPLTQGLTLDQKTVEVLVAHIIPTSKYFESRFDNLQYQVSEIKDDIKNLETRMNQRFEQVDKRFEQVDKRFEQVDKRFGQMDAKLDKLIERIDRRTDEGLRENRVQMMRMFTFAMIFSAISMVGLMGKLLNLF